MELGLVGKKALVTGSTKGIGKAIAIELAREGADVIINGRKADVVEQVRSEIQDLFPKTNPLGIAADIVQEEARSALFNEISDIDILVNNMGIFETIDYFDATDEIWEKFFRTNVLAGNDITKFYFKKMLEKNEGKIIFISSEEAFMASGNMAPYSMTKLMNISLAKNLAKLTTGTKVRINSVLPGSTGTEGVAALMESLYKDSDIPEANWGKDFMEKQRPSSQLQDLIDPIEIGRMVAFLASPFCSAISGTAIRVDGGIVPTII